MSTTMNIRMLDETVKQTERLAKKFKAPSRSDVVRRAIGLSDLLVNALEKGDKLYIEGHGVKKEILIPGVSNEK
jgi:predicted transcriptional regulator